MFTSKHYINLISSSITGLVSLIFVYKYSLSHFNSPVLSAFVYALLFLFVIYSFDKIKLLPNWANNNYYFVGAIFLFIVLLLYYIFFTAKPSASFGLLSIKNWLNNLYNGTFPYRLRNAFSAYPFFYLSVSPFYFIGNIALVEVLAWGTLAILVLFNSLTAREKIIKLFFLLVSPITFYGLFEASGYFLNAVFLITLIYTSNKFVQPGKINISFILFALLFGLFLSIRIEVIIVLIIFLIYFFRDHSKEGFLFYEILLAVFLITIIPFIIWNPLLFFINGPFSSFFMFDIPWWGIILYLIAAVYVGWMVSDLQEIFFSIGILLIIPCLINFLFGDNSSLSGFIYSLPFIIFSIKDYRVVKFTGKILGNADILEEAKVF
jgi:hypothetical protein